MAKRTQSEWSRVTLSRQTQGKHTESDGPTFGILGLAPLESYDALTSTDALAPSRPLTRGSGSASDNPSFHQTVQFTPHSRVVRSKFGSGLYFRVHGLAAWAS